MCRCATIREFCCGEKESFMGPFQVIIFIVWALSALALIALVRQGYRCFRYDRQLAL